VKKKQVGSQRFSFYTIYISAHFWRIIFALIIRELHAQYDTTGSTTQRAFL
jgi:hypothetical protein